MAGPSAPWCRLGHFSRKGSVPPAPRAAFSRPHGSLPPLLAWPFTPRPQGAAPPSCPSRAQSSMQAPGQQGGRGPRSPWGSLQMRALGWSHGSALWGQCVRSHGDMGFPSPDQSPECGAVRWPCGLRLPSKMGGLCPLWTELAMWEPHRAEGSKGADLPGSPRGCFLSPPSEGWDLRGPVPPCSCPWCLEDPSWSSCTLRPGRARGGGAAGPWSCWATPPCLQPPSTPAAPPAEPGLLTHTLSKSWQAGRGSCARGHAFARFPGRQRHVSWGRNVEAPKREAPPGCHLGRPGGRLRQRCPVCPGDPAPELGTQPGRAGTLSRVLPSRAQPTR